MKLSGLRDKLYWRPTLAGWHCYKSSAAGGYVSLCGRYTSARSGGQGCARPPAFMRCARCDVSEIERRGWDESGPELPEWRDWRVPRRSMPRRPSEVLAAEIADANRGAR